MQRALKCLIGTLALTAFVTGCGSSREPSTTGEAKSSLSRDMTPNVALADQQKVVASNNAFAFDVYKTLGTGNSDNEFFSPYSISSALAMTYAGANGSTATEMAKALHFDLPQTALHPAFDAIDLALDSDNHPACGGEILVRAVFRSESYRVSRHESPLTNTVTFRKLAVCSSFSQQSLARSSAPFVRARTSSPRTSRCASCGGGEERVRLHAARRM